MSLPVEIPFDVCRSYVGERPSVDTFTKLQEVVRMVFDEPALPVTREMIAQDVEAWDSVMHVTLMLEVEHAFGLRFTIPEMAYVKSVGSLADIIDCKLRASRSVVKTGFADRATEHREHSHP